MKNNDLILLAHSYSVSLFFFFDWISKKETQKTLALLQHNLCGAERDMCAMMSCWEAEGAHIEMLMSPHSGGDSWRGTEGWRHVSLDVHHRGKQQRGAGQSFRQINVLLGHCGACVFMYTPHPPSSSLKVKKAAESYRGWSTLTGEGGWVCINKTVNCTRGSDVTAEFPLSVTARQVLHGSLSLGFPLALNFPKLPSAVQFWKSRVWLSYPVLNS